MQKSLTTIMTEPKGILRNKSEASPEENALEFDRQEVIRNTVLNSQLRSDDSKGDKIRAKIAEMKEPEHGGEHLKWDELNLYKTEQEKCATMKIDEPKTPYEGGFDPSGEYYNDDDDNIPGFDLGEGENDNNVLESLNGGEVLKNDDEDIEDEEDEREEQLTAEEKHKRFEELRKKHYHMKALPLKQKMLVPDED